MNLTKNCYHKCCEKLHSFEKPENINRANEIKLKSVFDEIIFYNV